MAKKTKVESAAPAAPEDNTPTAPGEGAAPMVAGAAIPAKGTKPTNKDVFRRVRGADGKGVTPVKEDKTAYKVAPQAKIIVNCIEALEQGEDGAINKAGVTREALTAALPTVAGLVTKQPVDRITVYYQKDLVKQGWITLDKQSAATA